MKTLLLAFFTLIGCWTLSPQSSLAFTRLATPTAASSDDPSLAERKADRRSERRHVASPRNMSRRLRHNRFIAYGQKASSPMKLRKQLHRNQSQLRRSNSMKNKALHHGGIRWVRNHHK
jgi:hypothetical protein